MLLAETSSEEEEEEEEEKENELFRQDERDTPSC
jgi:hypothetical protein